MKERSWLISLGIIIYIILTAIDRFVFKIPVYAYIPIAVIVIALIITGFIKDKNKLEVIKEKRICWIKYLMQKK